MLWIVKTIWPLVMVKICFKNKTCIEIYHLLFPNSAPAVRVIWQNVLAHSFCQILKTLRCLNICNFCTVCLALHLKNWNVIDSKANWLLLLLTHLFRTEWVFFISQYEQLVYLAYLKHEHYLLGLEYQKLDVFC